MHKQKSNRFILKTMPLILATVYSCGAFAAEALEEVVVTAQKRAEKLQDVPISISAISGAQLETRGIESVANLNALAPNVMFTESPTATMISVVSIRGSVAGQPAIWMDPPVGMYVDGVYVGKSQGSVFDVIDVERIEVLRGPQGTLFGRNTQGGAINFISRKPAGVFGGSVGFEIGKHGHTLERIAVDLPKMGALSLSVGYRKEDRDGWLKNTTPGISDFGKVNKEAYRLSAHLDVSQNLQMDYKFDHSDANNTPRPQTIYALSGWSGPGALWGPYANYLTTSRPSSISTNAGNPLWERSKIDGHALTIDYTLDANNSLKYIYSNRKMRYSDALDLDGTPVTGGIPSYGYPTLYDMYYHRYTTVNSNSHELQWIGHINRLKYVAGLYSYEDKGTTIGPQNIFVALRSDYASNTNAKAWFGQLDYSVTDALTATLGIRHTTEEKSGWTHKFMTNGFNGPSVFEIINLSGYKASWSANTPVAALSYKLSDTTNVYTRVAKGFKSGGFSGELSSPTLLRVPFNPERSTSFEVGVKSSFMENRAYLAATLFQNKITDYHVTQLVPGTTVSFVTNAGKATYHGLELEGALSFADGWRFQGTYGYLNTKFDEYLDNALIPGAGGTFSAGGPIIDTASNRVAPYAPKHTLNLNLDGLLARTSYGKLRLIMDYSYTAAMYLYAGNKSLTAPNAGGQYLADAVKMPASTKINARLLLAGVPVGGPGKADVSLWVRNLTDHKKAVPSIDFGTLTTATWSEPRMYGMSFNYKW